MKLRKRKRRRGWQSKRGARGKRGCKACAAWLWLLLLCEDALSQEASQRVLAQRESQNAEGRPRPRPSRVDSPAEMDLESESVHKQHRKGLSSPALPAALRAYAETRAQSDTKALKSVSLPSQPGRGNADQSAIPGPAGRPSTTFTPCSRAMPPETSCPSLSPEFDPTLRLDWTDDRRWTYTGWQRTRSSV